MGNIPIKPLCVDNLFKYVLNAIACESECCGLMSCNCHTDEIAISRDEFTLEADTLIGAVTYTTR